MHFALFLSNIATISECVTEDPNLSTRTAIGHLNNTEWTAIFRKNSLGRYVNKQSCRTWINWSEAITQKKTRCMVRRSYDWTLFLWKRQRRNCHCHCGLLDSYHNRLYWWVNFRTHNLLPLRYKLLTENGIKSRSTFLFVFLHERPRL